MLCKRVQCKFYSYLANFIYNVHFPVWISFICFWLNVNLLSDYSVSHLKMVSHHDKCTVDHYRTFLFFFSNLSLVIELMWFSWLKCWDSISENLMWKNINWWYLRFYYFQPTHFGIVHLFKLSTLFINLFDILIGNAEAITVH